MQACTLGGPTSCLTAWVRVQAGEEALVEQHATALALVCARRQARAQAVGEALEVLDCVPQSLRAMAQVRRGLWDEQQAGVVEGWQACPVDLETMQLGMVSLQQLVCWAAQAVLLAAMVCQEVMTPMTLRTLLATVSQEEWA